MKLLIELALCLIGWAFGWYCAGRWLGRKRGFVGNSEVAYGECSTWNIVTGLCLLTGNGGGCAG